MWLAAVESLITFPAVECLFPFCKENVIPLLHKLSGEQNIVVKFFFSFPTTPTSLGNGMMPSQTASSLLCEDTSSSRCCCLFAWWWEITPPPHALHQWGVLTQCSSQVEPDVISCVIGLRWMKDEILSC